MKIESTLENLTKTLLYEGYSLFPYNRSSIKNKKPVPFGVVYPEDYYLHNSNAQSIMQSECILSDSNDPVINVEIKFLHLLKHDLYKYRKAENDFIPIEELTFFGNFLSGGWEAVERTITLKKLNVKKLLSFKISRTISFNKSEDIKLLQNEDGELIGKQISYSQEINGSIIVEAEAIKEFQNSFKISAKIFNSSEVKSAETISRDDVLLKSFLSTHTVLSTDSGQFISDQNPEKKWQKIIKLCRNINTWPILIDKNNSTILSSPIIIYDYPEINPKSNLDLFDSTEIEEALMLHVAVLSEEEKKKIGQSDQKLNAMLNKVKNITPQELMKLHTSLEEIKTELTKGS